MDQFVVPQFIDVEDKILGPITTRQFIIMIVAGLFLVICYKLFDISLFILIALVTFGLVGLFGFYKVNGRYFHHFLLSVFQLGMKPSLRVWSKSDAESLEATMQGEEVSAVLEQPHRRFSHARLAELALEVDTGGVYEAEQDK
ncbi:MAG: PrgI family protein [Patescibacteria group bacterium]